MVFLQIGQLADEDHVVEVKLVRVRARGHHLL